MPENYSQDLPKFFTFTPPNMFVHRKHGQYSLHASHPIPKDTELGIIRIHFKKGYNPTPDRLYERTAGWSEMVNENREDPSCLTYRIPVTNNDTIDYLVAARTLKDIKPGNEITWPYTLDEYEGAPWRNQVIDVQAKNVRPQQGRVNGH